MIPIQLFWYLASILQNTVLEIAHAADFLLRNPQQMAVQPQESIELFAIDPSTYKTYHNK
jgi:hypothetical protein